MTRARFSYSEIRGSTLAWQLPAAYRSLQRPSSASSAKASTGCPLQLAETMLALAMEFSGIGAGQTGACKDVAPSGGGPVVRRQARARRRAPDPKATHSAAFKAAQCAQHADTRVPGPVMTAAASRDAGWSPRRGWVPKG